MLVEVRNIHLQPPWRTAPIEEPEARIWPTHCTGIVRMSCRATDPIDNSCQLSVAAARQRHGFIGPNRISALGITPLTRTQRHQKHLWQICHTSLHSSLDQRALAEVRVTGRGNRGNFGRAPQQIQIGHSMLLGWFHGCRQVQKHRAFIACRTASAGWTFTAHLLCKSEQRVHH